ncbi:MAG: putative cobaltochelatase [Dehalococcoidia bacterium]|nr:putative cobaltochelatase [Dehalococcoidia bacterium]
MNQASRGPEEPRFPFSAIVGQDRMKLALLLNAINPAIGGVLIRGNKGTAKSTAVRALAALLPPIAATEGCPFNCPPAPENADCPALDEHRSTHVATHPVRIVDLPVGASEDRLVGSLDVERALQAGQRAFEPGILAAAHRGILYIDEVNLLSDHLVDVLLDAAAMGRNYVERDGISVSHPSRFILIGTMNPEEGELRPQLLDRFGLMVEAEDRFEPAARAEVVRRRIAFEANPPGFGRRWAEEQSALRERLERARTAVSDVTVPDAMIDAITTLCAACEVDGLRADIVIYRASQALAAWDGRSEVTLDDVRTAAELALVHRQRRQPFQEPQLDQERIDDALRPFENNDPGDDDPPPSEGEPPDDDPGDEPDDQPPPPSNGDAPDERRAEIGEAAQVRAPDIRRPDQRERAASGRRMETRSDSQRGRHMGARRPTGAVHDPDILATVQAAALRGATGCEGRPVITRQDLREKVRETLAATLIVFVVDASGSMGARRRMEAAKGAVLSLLVDAYQHRDRVALVAFRGDRAEVLLPPTNSVEQAHRALAQFVTGGRTPVGAGLERASELVERARRRDPGMVPLVVLVSDGRANVAPDGMDPVMAATTAATALRAAGARALVIDTEQGYIRLGLARELSNALGGDYVALDEITAESVARVVRGERAGTVL